MPKPLLIVSIFCLIFYSCSKEKQKPQTTNIIKITLLSGNNQTSAVGNPLNDSVVVKVTNNGAPLNNCTVQFTGSGCNSDLTAELNTKADGTVKYLWRLAANQGSQTLNIVAVNGGVKADSVTVSANAISPNASEQISACTPYNLPARNICQLTSGRLVACFQGIASLRYSDDNGISWNPLVGFGNSHYITSIVTTAQNEIFAATYGDGVFYSKDAGSTWADITPPTFNKAENSVEIEYSGSELIFIGQRNDIYISSDKGQTWLATSNGLAANFSYKFPCKLNNGDLYVDSWGFTLYKSTDNGSNWLPQNDSTALVLAICTDNNGWFYKSVLFTKGVNGQGYDIVYVSKDNGQTFTSLFNVYDFVYSLTVQGGNLYYCNTTSLYEYGNGSPLVPVTFEVINSIYNTLFIRNYILLSPNNFVYISGPNGLIYYN